MEKLELKVEKKMDEKEVDALVNTKEVSESVIEKSLNYDELSEEEKEAIETKHLIEVMQYRPLDRKGVADL